MKMSQVKSHFRSINAFQNQEMCNIKFFSIRSFQPINAQDFFIFTPHPLHTFLVLLNFPKLNTLFLFVI